MKKNVGKKVCKVFVYCNMKWQEYIVSEPKILMGKPTIKGTRISVELILELFSLGWNEAQVLDSYPSISSESLKAVFAYLKDCIQQELYFSITA
ncbi:MAG TPA: DUF433 domain-containing protein [Hanamia sp.]|jgi:uncharacterized protein (DUF433 family)|nr:DUF433 domain-containing protein [Hanamia sp.]